MRMAVPYEDGKIFQDFGKAQALRIYDTATERQALKHSAKAGKDGSEHQRAS